MSFLDAAKEKCPRCGSTNSRETLSTGQMECLEPGCDFTWYNQIDKHVSWTGLSYWVDLTLV